MEGKEDLIKNLEIWKELMTQSNLRSLSYLAHTNRDIKKTLQLLII